MEKNNRYFDTNRAKIYKDIYRPSSNPTRFLATLIAVLLQGHSPLSSSYYYHIKKKK